MFAVLTGSHRMSEALVLPLQNRLSETATCIIHGIRANAVLYIFAAFVFLAAVAESIWIGLPFDIKMVTAFTAPVLSLLCAIIIFGIIVEFVRLYWTGYKGSALSGLWLKISDDYLAPQRISNSIHAFLFMSLYMLGFAFIKKAIPLAVPFSWDITFMQWDQVLHFGRHPYELLAPLLNVPWVTFLINVNYNIWFFVMFTCWFWQGFGPKDTALRMRFLLGFTLTWFMGTSVLGTIFSSVGPGLYGRLLPGAVDPFAPLMGWLNNVAQTHTIFVIPTMNELWKDYESGTGLINGISAMPSMHVGTSVLFAILGFASGKKWLGYLMSAFAFLIFIGSVHLGWHYAIDGYAGAAIAVVCWWVSGKVVDWDRRKRGLA
jgi:hypothetical protein